MELRLAALDVRLFTVCAECKTFVAEASDLYSQPLQQRLYDDAADTGFALWNSVKNTVTRWYWAEDVRDGEGELIVTLYAPTSETLRMHPQLAGWKVHVLND